MIELVFLLIIIAFSIAFYYFTKVSTKETSYDKILEEQRQNKISIINILPQKQKKVKKKKKKEDESLKKEKSNSGVITIEAEEKVSNKILSNKENERNSEIRLRKKKELEISSNSDEKADKENSADKEVVATNKGDQKTFTIAKNTSVKTESKKVEKIQQNNNSGKNESKKVEKIRQNNSVENFCTRSDNKFLEKYESNTSSKGKQFTNSDIVEKPEHKLSKVKHNNSNSNSVEKHENNKPLKQKHNNSVASSENNSSTDSVRKHENNKSLKQKHNNSIASSESNSSSDGIKKHENNKSLKQKNNNNVVSSSEKSNSPNEKSFKELTKKDHQKTTEIKDALNHIQKSATTVHIVGKNEVNKLNSTSVKDAKKKVGNAIAPSVELSYSKLKQFIQKNQLTGSESQILIEALLNKQSSGNTGGEWIEKGKVLNPTNQLQRQLEEYQSKLEKESETNRGYLAKISSLRNDLNSERSRCKNLQEELKSSSALLQQKLSEIAATQKEQLLLQTNEIRKNLNQEFSLKLAQKEEQLKAENEINIQKFKSKESDFERQLQQLQTTHQTSEMNSEKVRKLLAETQIQLDNFNKERDELLQTCQTYQQHLSSLKEQTSEHELRMKTHLSEVEQELKSKETSEQNLISKVNQLSEEKRCLEHKLNDFESTKDDFSQNQIKLENIIQEKKEFENQVQTYENDICNLHELLRKKELEILCLTEKNNELSTRFRPVNNTKENGAISNSFSPEENICSCGKQIIPSNEEKDSFITDTPSTHENGLKTPSKKETSSVNKEEKIKIVEKIIEKVIQDPLTLEQLEETKKENNKMKIQIDCLTEEKRLLEENLKEAPVVDQSKLVEDLQVENKSLVEKVDNYQRILSNTETLLKTLQKSVENEEHTWREKLLQNEETLRQVAVEKDELVLEVQELRKSLQNANEFCKIETELSLVKEKLQVETKAKNKLEEELVSVQEQLKSAGSPQWEKNGTADGIHQNEQDSDSIASSQDQVLLQPEKKKKKNGKLPSTE